MSKNKIKLIVEVDEELYNAVKGSDYEFEKSLTAIANGIPYDEAESWKKSNELLEKRLAYLGNSSGDCISREALRKAFHKRIYYFDKSSWDEANALIENAPTVDIKDQIAGAYNEGYMCGNREAEKGRPQGDCISREALKEQVKNEVCEVCFTSPDERQCSPNCKLCTFNKLIDNAPTVPQVTVFTENADEKAVADMKAELQSVIERPQGDINEQTYKDAYEQGYADGWKERYGEPDGRPKGEWIIDENGDYICNQCNNYPLRNDNEELTLSNFCSNCGADMRGKEE